jgi:protein-L-isoaspartate O-methyltransferase
MLANEAVSLSTSALRWAARRWRSVGLHSEALQACLAPQSGDTSVEGLLPLWCWQTRAPTAFNALTQLLVLGQAVPLPWAAKALSDLDAWIKRGFFVEKNQRLAATVALSLHGSLEILSDAQPANETEAAHHVMGATNASRTLARCLLPGAKKHSLDLGTGSGFLALHLARQSETVLATDLNPRSLHFAKSNATLANAPNIKIKKANVFQGLPQGHFDWIVGNLPFVISPESRFVYRDGGMQGDAFCAAVVKQAGSYLAPNGIAQFLVQWIHPHPDPVDQIDPRDQEERRLASWVQGNGCHALALRFRVQTVQDYALEWSTGPFSSKPNHKVKRFAAWMKFYEMNKIAAISTAMIVLKRSGRAKPWLAIHDWPTPESPCGAEILSHLRAIERGR